MSPGEKAEGVVKRSFTGEIRPVPYEATQPCQGDQKKLGTEIGSCRKVLWRTLLSNGMPPPPPMSCTGGPQVLEDVTAAETLPTWIEKGRDRMK